MVVLFPSPAGVGETAVMSTSLPSGRWARPDRYESDTFAFVRP